ncbi:hypothetical protein ACO0QE_000871 [Hanseniaspora vineae]
MYQPPSDPVNKAKHLKTSQLCELCHSRKAVIKRPKNLMKICKECFYYVFETEIHNTIVSNNLFYKGERVAVGASGGKDSTVLAYVLKLLNERHNYGIEIVLFSIDEGIVGYRDDSLATVKRNQKQYNLPLEIVSYRDLYNWTMDEIVACAGVRNSCTYCGVFRRQALDRGANKLDIAHVVTGHNADDMAETVLMNILRGDVARLEKSTAIMTISAGSPVKRSKPFKYSYQKEIVLYAHYKKLDYFSTECTYAPEAFRGTARELMKNLEAIRPSCIIDIIHSGENLVLKPKKQKKQTVKSKNVRKTEPAQQQEVEIRTDGTVSLNFKDGNRCERCGYLSSNRICKACTLLEGLAANRAKVQLDMDTSTDGAAKVVRDLEKFGPKTDLYSDSISNGKKPLNLQTAYRYQRKNKSKYGTPNLSSPDDYLPAIQGTIAHEWGSPRVVRPGSPIILDKKSSTVKQGKKVEFENIERQDGDKKTDAKRKSNRLARIFSNQDFLNLSVENEEDKHLIDKLKAVSYSDNTTDDAEQYGFSLISTPQRENSDMISWPDDDHEIELHTDGKDSSTRKSSTTSSNESSDGSKFSFEFNSSNGRKASVKYYSKDGNEESGVYFDDMFEDEDLDEDMNVDEYDDLEDFEDFNEHNQYSMFYDDESQEDKDTTDFNKNVSTFKFNDITALTDDEIDSLHETSNNNSFQETYENNADDNDEFDDMDSVKIDSSFSQEPQIPVKTKKEKAITGFNDLYQLSDDEGEDEDEDENDILMKNLNDYDEESYDANTFDDDKQMSTINAKILSEDETNSKENENFIKHPQNKVLQPQKVKKYNDLFALSDDEEEEENDLYGLDEDENDDDYASLYDHETESLKSYSNTSDFTPRKPLTSKTNESELQNFSTPVLVSTPASPLGKNLTFSPLLGKSNLGKSSNDPLGLVALALSPKTPRSPVNRLPPNSILKYHDLNSNLDSGVVPRTMGDLFFIDELEEEHHVSEDDLYLDEINKVPEDFDFESNSETVSQNTTGLNSYPMHFNSNHLKKPADFLRRKSYKGSHSFFEKPTSIIKSNKPISSKVELKKQNKTVTFFHINNQQLQRSSSDPGIIVVKKPNLTRHQSETLLDSADIKKNDKNTKNDKAGFVGTDLAKSAAESFEKDHCSMFQTPSKFSEANSLSPIQEGWSSVETSPRVLMKKPFI